MLLFSYCYWKLFITKLVRLAMTKDVLAFCFQVNWFSKITVLAKPSLAVRSTGFTKGKCISHVLVQAEDRSVWEGRILLSTANLSETK